MRSGLEWFVAPRFEIEREFEQLSVCVPLDKLIEVQLSFEVELPQTLQT